MLDLFLEVLLYHAKLRTHHTKRRKILLILHYHGEVFVGLIQTLEKLQDQGMIIHGSPKVG